MPSLHASCIDCEHNWQQPLEILFLKKKKIIFVFWQFSTAKILLRCWQWTFLAKPQVPYFWCVDLLESILLHCFHKMKKYRIIVSSLESMNENLVKLCSKEILLSWFKRTWEQQMNNKCIFGQNIFFDMWKRYISVIYCTNTQRKRLHINKEIVNLKF